MKTRFLMIWTPWRRVEEAAIKRGMAEDGSGGSYWDYVGFEEFEICQSFASFTAALTIARGKRTSDVWREPRIYEQHDNGFGWDSVRFWEVRPGVTKADSINVE